MGVDGEGVVKGGTYGRLRGCKGTESCIAGVLHLTEEIGASPGQAL